MTTSSTELILIDQIRNDSRRMVRELGFMQPTLASTDFSASAVHTILELGMNGSLTAVALSDILKLKKSSVSRLVAKLIEQQIISESVDASDARIKPLALTEAGHTLFKQIEQYGRSQVMYAFDYLTPEQRRAVQQGLSFYAKALEAHRTGKPPQSCEIQIVRGYRPGVVARVTEMHINYYHRHSGFGQFFESKVAGGLAEFCGRLDKSQNAIWLALDGERIVGSLAIDGEDLGDNVAHLRWFIIDDGLRGAGVGRRLMAEAMAFCDRCGFVATHLWTFSGLNAARKLYEDAGFQLFEEFAGEQWGKEVVEQRFVRPLPAGNGR
jgi:DNA-binding MarR family transcriptional regulator/GNAT superfamily N-acetyltransferase